MLTLKQYIKNASERHVAIGHFNISNIETMWSVFAVAKKMDTPVILGVSENERDFIGAKQCVALVRSLREEFDHPVFLNADHTYSIDKVKKAIDAGFDSVIYDGAKLELMENISNTKECVEYARSVNPNILVEGELGYIGQSSKILDKIPEGASISENEMTSPGDAEKFVKETGVDLFAPAVGNIHGILRTGHNPALDITRIKSIREVIGIPLVLHGGSGISEMDFRHAIGAGVSIIHISTELRIAYRNALSSFLQKNPDEVAPYRIMENSMFEMEHVTEEKLKIFTQAMI